MAAAETKTLDETIAEIVARKMAEERELARKELRNSFDEIFRLLLKMKKHAPDDLLDENAVAEYTGLTVSALQSWRSERKNIPFTKLSTKSVRYKFKDVLDFVDRGRVKVTRDGEII